MPPPLEDVRLPVRLRLSLLWVSLMFCYVYGDYFGLYVPGKLAAMSEGRMDGFGALTSGLLTGIALMMAIPGLMVALSALLPAAISKWTNVILGFAYAAIVALTMAGRAPSFYLTLGVIEIVVSLAIAGTALRWPRQKG